MKEHKESTLPKWTQELIAGLRRDVQDLQTKLDNQSAASVILTGRDWFPIYGPTGPDGEWRGAPAEVYHLWMLYPDQPHAVCSLRGRDVLLLGRNREEWQNEIGDCYRQGKTSQGE